MDNLFIPCLFCNSIYNKTYIYVGIPYNKEYKHITIIDVGGIFINENNINIAKIIYNNQNDVIYFDEYTHTQKIINNNNNKYSINYIDINHITIYSEYAKYGPIYAIVSEINFRENILKIFDMY
eukprot:GHVR01025301.1.p1 GENE.GHVR01025301.1~~GHVR01025301.1.p1  ORF type:complete len:132 (-),score=43.59 GHVR01025301.1:198-569(-)